MGTSKKESLDEYDENNDEHRVELYYSIIPEESYEGDFSDDYVESEFEVPDYVPTRLSLVPDSVLTYRATIDELNEIPELVSDIQSSRLKFFEVFMKENCYEKFIKSIRTKAPELRINFSPNKDGYLFIKMDV